MKQVIYNTLYNNETSDKYYNTLYNSETSDI